MQIRRRTLITIDRSSRIPAYDLSLVLKKVAKNRFLAYNCPDIARAPIPQISGYFTVISPMETDQINFLPQDETPLETQPPKPSRRGVFLFLGIIVMGIFIYSFVSGKNDSPDKDPLAYDPVTLEPKKPKNIFRKLQYIVFNHNQKTLVGEKDDRINILILGIGGPGHDGPFLTDTILIASLKPSTKQISLVSIPRDLAVEIPGYGTQKINSADAYGEKKQTDWGGAYATEIISRTLDIEIPYYIRVDFKAFEDIINEVGGVKVEVDRSFTDTMFPAPADLFQTVSFKKGLATMDGETALQFARSRHGDNGEGSDFARSKRQQKMLVALKEKVLSYNTLLNPIKINSIINSLESHITTNLEFSDIMTLIKQARELNTADIVTLTLDDSPTGYLRSAFSAAGAFILVPKSGNFQEIRLAIKNIFSGAVGADNNNAPAQDAPAGYTPAAKIEIQNGTWNAGLAARIKKRLNNKNIEVETVGNSLSKPIEKSGVYQIRASSTASALINAIVSELQIPAYEATAGNINAATGTDILIILGADYAD